MPQRVDLAPYVKEIEDIFAKNEDQLFMEFALKILRIRKDNGPVYRVLHQELPKHLKGKKRFLAFVTLGFHANMFLNGMNDLEVKLEEMRRDGMIGGSNQATVDEVRIFFTQAIEIYSAKT